MLQVKDLSITIEKDLRTIIDKLSFVLSKGDRLAVIGEEGDGKSALLKAIYDKEMIADYARVEGEIHKAGEKISYLVQEIRKDSLDMSVLNYCLANEDFLNMKPKELARLSNSLNLPLDICYSDTKISELSGGEKVKLQLLLCLCQNPTILLLDEPSNDLDENSLRFLEDFILSLNIPLIFVSHDETLLKRTATRVLHLESLIDRRIAKWTLSNVPYNSYVSQREDAFLKQEQMYKAEKRDEEIKKEKLDKIYRKVEHAQRTISRGDPHGGRLLKKKMKAVKSLEHRYEMEEKFKTEKPQKEVAIDAKFDEREKVPLSKTLLDFELSELKIKDRLLSKNISLQIKGREKVLIVGDNGTGKTSLLRRIVADLSHNKSIKFAYMPQQYKDILDLNISCIEFLNKSGAKDERDRISKILGALKFTRAEMEKKISSLSGGQKAKLIILSLILSDAEIIILDEPSRNLSPLSAPVIRKLLLNFTGAVLCVSHDRILIDMWQGKVLRLTSDGLIEEK